MQVYLFEKFYIYLNLVRSGASNGVLFYDPGSFLKE